MKRLLACVFICLAVASCNGNPLQNDPTTPLATTSQVSTVKARIASVPNGAAVNCDTEKSTFVSQDNGVTTLVTNGSDHCYNDYLGAMFFMPHPPPDWDSQVLVDLVELQINPGESRLMTLTVPPGDCTPFQTDKYVGITKADAGPNGVNIHPAHAKYYPVAGTGLLGLTGSCAPAPPTPPKKPIPPMTPPPSLPEPPFLPPPPASVCKDLVRDAHVYASAGQAWFTVPAGVSLQLSLVGYELNPGWPAVFLPQRFIDGATGVFGPGNWSLTVRVSGKRQLDLYCGGFEPEDLTEANFDSYNSRQIAWDVFQ